MFCLTYKIEGLSHTLTGAEQCRHNKEPKMQQIRSGLGLFPVGKSAADLTQSAMHGALRARIPQNPGKFLNPIHCWIFYRNPTVEHDTAN